MISLVAVHERSLTPKDKHMTVDQMDEGAFALVDCLGWKGIWNRKSDTDRTAVEPHKVLEKIDKIEKRVADSTELLRKMFASSILDIKYKPRVTFLSDTVVVSVPTVKHRSRELTVEVKRGLAVHMACIAVSEVIEAFVEEAPFISMRGCVTFGSYLMRRTTIVGPAVDEAANNFELPQGAFVWIHPNAALYLDHYRQEQKRHYMDVKEKAKGQLDENSITRLEAFMSTAASDPIVLEDYPMPLKGGEVLTCHVINPLGTIREQVDREESTRRHLLSFDSSKIDVLLKRQNTEQLLSVGATESQRFYGQAIDTELLEKLYLELLPSAK